MMEASVCSQNPKCLALAATPPHMSYWNVRMQIDDSNKPFSDSLGMGTAGVQSRQHSLPVLEEERPRDWACVSAGCSQLGGDWQELDLKTLPKWLRCHHVWRTDVKSKSCR